MSIVNKRGRPRIDISGLRFGRIIALCPASGGFWLCQCACGKRCRVTGANLRGGRQQSCGCLKRTHGASYTKEYKAYGSAKDRCTNSRNPKYRYYGGRGVRFRFRSFSEFFAALGPRPSSAYSVDRINNDGHYEPGNVRWATATEQSRNRKDRGRLGSNQFKRRK